VYRSIGDRYHDAYGVQRQKFGAGSIVVMGGITERGRTPVQIVNGNLIGVRYLDEII
jgi:hypothetical protein